jgi:Flp pilus assembly protein TadG
MRKNNRERGTVLVMTAILTPVLIFILGFAIDFGVMFGVRNAAQNAADAAAIAGAVAYSQSGDPGDPAVATSPANKASLANAIFGGTTVTPTSVNAFRGVPCTDSPGIENYCVQVTVNVTSPVFFARVNSVATLGYFF